MLPPSKAKPLGSAMGQNHPVASSYSLFSSGLFCREAFVLVMFKNQARATGLVQSRARDEGRWLGRKKKYETTEKGSRS